MSDAPGDGRWSVTRLAALLYPLAAAAVAASVPLGLPAARLCGRWVRRMMDEAGR